MIGAATLAGGEARGAPLTLSEPLSFWGGYDAATGRIIDRWHPQCGLPCAGRILLMPAVRGSSSGASVLAEAIRAGTAPAAIVLGAREAILTVGSLVAAELYGLHCPIVVVDPADLPRLAAARSLHVRAGAGGAAITLDDCL